MKKIITNVSLVLLLATGTVFAQSKNKTNKSTQSDLQNPKTEMDTTRAGMKRMQEQTGQMEIKDTLQTTTRSATQNSKAEMDTTQSGMNRTQQSMNQTGTKTSTQTQGNSAGGTSAWPMSTGTVGSTTEKSDTTMNKNGAENTSTSQTQTQGNSAGGTSAWPQSTGTAAATTPVPDSLKVEGSNGEPVSEAGNMKMKKSDKKMKGKNKKPENN